jgi:Mg/Co/Ni transporter MgtE
MPTANTEESDAERLRHFQAYKEEAIAVLDGDGRLVGTVKLDGFVRKRH